MALVSYTAICPWGAWFTSRRTCIHKFTNVDSIVLWAGSLVVVGFTGVAFGLDLGWYGVAVDLHWF